MLTRVDRLLANCKPTKHLALPNPRQLLFLTQHVPEFPSLQHQLQRILHHLLQLPHKLPSNRAVHDLVIKAPCQYNLLIPPHTAFSTFPSFLCRYSHLPRSANRQNHRLRRINHRREPLDGIIHAHIRYRDCATLILLRLQLSISRALTEILDLRANGLQTQAIRARNNGRHQSHGSGDGDRDIDAVMRANRNLAARRRAPRGIGGGHAARGGRERLDEEVVDRQLVGAIGGGVERLAQREQLADGHGAGDEVVRVLVHGLGEAGGDGAAHAAGGRVGVGGERGARGAGCRCGGGLEFLNVGQRDAAAGAGAFDFGDGHALFEGGAFGGGAGGWFAVECGLETGASGVGFLGAGSGSVVFGWWWCGAGFFAGGFGRFCGFAFLVTFGRGFVAAGIF